MRNGIVISGQPHAFGHVDFAQRVLRNVCDRSRATILLGVPYRYPFGICPMGLSALAAYDGDIVLADAARDTGIPAIMSATSLTPLERVAGETGSRWF
ncbi:MAG: hypothetical protein EOO83_01615 [Oxalobacteraceae bacterium]|nr:MAG: hypothetical protein EOO83_01615 [Oxalobacteraceae bacterium]